MTAPVLQVERLAKEYRLGVLGRARFLEELRGRWRRRRAGATPPAAPVLGAPRRAARLAEQMDPLRPEWFWALQDVSFEVGPGEVLGIIGANGAGKSTLLKVLARVTEPTRGRVRMVGRVASLLEVGTGFHHELTGRENVFVNGAILGMREREIRAKFDAIVEFAEIADFIDTPVKRYSSGMRTRLAFAVAAHLEADLLLLDEVLSVGDASFQKKCLGKMEDMAGHGRTVLLVSHRFGSIAEMCDRVLWIDRGRVRMDGPTDGVIEAYLASVAESSGARDWEQGICSRRDSRFAVHGLRLLNHRGERVAAVDAGHDFEIEVEYALRAALTSLRLGVEIGSVQGTPIFTTLDVDDPGVAPARAPGRYLARVRLPAGFLAPGRRALSLAVELPGTVRALTLPNLMIFDILEGAAPGLVETHMRKGLVRPRLAWQVTRAGEAPAEAPAACEPGEERS
ncbi:MAG TPA: ABC transporter ATP-binding protein [Candidatus Methanoperedens sp.]|nr:ABC transporter ATP-binding protein [Candidatus Methanoperedens sp.]